nr:bikaverin cluster transcription factor bik5 [Quercus suber]
MASQIVDQLSARKRAHTNSGQDLDFDFTRGETHGRVSISDSVDQDYEQDGAMNEDNGLGNAALLTNEPHVDAHGRTLNPRSCVTCRKRKVRCDKVHPCANCARAHIVCIFPSPGRAPRKVRKLGEGRDKELLDRLRRLEGVVKGLGVDVPEKEIGDSAETREGAGESVRSGDEPLREDTIHQQDASRKERRQRRSSDETHKERTKWVDGEQKGRFENRFGRLVINEGKSRYINNTFWASLSNEVEDLKGILNQSSDEEDAGSPESTTVVPPNHQGWTFGFSSHSVDMLSLHPLPTQIESYWETYVDRVDPLCKVLHIPTLRPVVLKAASHLNNLSKSFECLMFTIYYAATTSLTPEECAKLLGEQRQVLLSRYRFGVEQALARANFLTTEEIVVLQAFVVFLICLRRNNDARVIWTLTGLSVRIAQTMGIHRDGSHFDLPPFEVEMRRRLWWQVCVLDTRSSEDHGCDPTIIEQTFDTNLPLNINDVDIHPTMTEFPPDRQGCTDMSFCRIRFEVSNTFRRINYIPPGPQSPNLTNITLQDKERWLEDCHERLQERYLKHCDASVPLFWVTATVARLMMSKMWLMVFHPMQHRDGGASLSAETKEKLFITSLESVEYSLLLETESRTMKWGWLFKTHVQWHALAFMLSELCRRTTGDLVERAWVALEKTRNGHWGPVVTEDGSSVKHLWRPLKKLYRKAKEARTKGLHEEWLSKQGAAVPSNPTTESRYGLHGSPKSDNKTELTVAPLSNAQLKRFTQEMTYGPMAPGTHDQLRSPTLSETQSLKATSPLSSTKTLENVARESDSLRQHEARRQAETRRQSDLAQPPTKNFTTSSLPSVSQRTSLCDQNGLSIQPSGPEMRQNYFSQPQPAMGFAQFHQNSSAMPYSTESDTVTAVNGNLSSFPLDDMSMDALDSSAYDLDPNGLMDPTGNLNWEDWHQLVQQYSMDVDSGTNATPNFSTAYQSVDMSSDLPPGGSGGRACLGFCPVLDMSVLTR